MLGLHEVLLHKNDTSRDDSAPSIMAAPSCARSRCDPPVHSRSYNLVRSCVTGNRARDGRIGCESFAPPEGVHIDTLAYSRPGTVHGVPQLNDQRDGHALRG